MELHRDIRHGSVNTEQLRLFERLQRMQKKILGSKGEMIMEALEFLRNYDRMCSTIDKCSECPAVNMKCCELYTDEQAKLVEIVEKWAKEHPEETEQERQEPENPEESSDLHAIIDALEDRIDKLDGKVSNEALIFREVSKRNQDAHRQLADRITALEKYPVESMNKLKRTNKDVLLSAFPNARMDNEGIPYACPIRLDAHYNCDKFENCLRCRHTHWLAEVEK